MNHATCTAPDSLTNDRIPDFVEIPLMHHSITLELLPHPIAWLSDKPGYVSYMVYEFPVRGTPMHLWNAYDNSMVEAGPVIKVLPCDEPLVLPFMSQDAAEDAAMHAYFSGASLHVCSIVRAVRGPDALHDFADTQNMFSMPGAPELPEETLMWLGSGL